jgi:hypothetical protein
MYLFVAANITSGRFTPGERAPGTHWIGGSVGLRAGLDAVVKRKNHYLCQELNRLNK